MVLVLLLFATFGGRRQRAEAVKRERWVVAASLKPRQPLLTAACNTATHKMWHSRWRDTAVSLFYSVIKTTSVRVHLLLTGSVGQSRRANLLYTGARIGSAARVPRAGLADYLLEELVLQRLCTAGVPEPHPAGPWVGYHQLNLFGNQSAPHLLQAWKEKPIVHFKAKFLGTKMNLLIAFFT